MVVVKDVVLNVTGSTRQVDAELEQLQNQLRALDHTNASFQIKSDDLQARRQLASLREDLRKIDRTQVSPTIGARLDTRALDLDKFEARLDALSKKKLTSPEAVRELIALRGIIQGVGRAAQAAGVDVERSEAAQRKAMDATAKAAEAAANRRAAAAEKAAKAERDANVERRSIATTPLSAGDSASLNTAAVTAERVRASLQAVRTYLAGIGEDEQFKIDVDDLDAKRELETLRVLLEGIDRTKVEPRIAVQIGKALADVELLDERIAALGDKTVNIKTRRGIVAELGQIERGVVGVATAATTAASTGVRTFGETLGSVMQGLKQLAPLISGATLVLGAGLAPALALVAGGLVGAAAGVAALVTALAALAGPVVIVAIATVQRFAKVLEAIKLQDQAKDAAARKSAEGTKAAATAAEQRHTAERGVSDALKAASRAEEALGRAAANVAEARTAAYRAMEDAAEDASDAIRGIAQAELSQDQASLNYRKAKKDLADYREEIGAAGRTLDSVFQKFTDISVDFDTGAFRRALTGAGGTGTAAGDLDLEQKILDVRQARLNEKDATDGVSDARTKAQRAGELEAKYLRDGIRAYPGFISALESERAAREHVADATDNVREARRRLATVRANADLDSDQTEKAAQAVGKLSGAERDLLGVLQRARGAFRAAFGGVTDSVIGSIAAGLEGLPALLDRVKGAFQRLGDAIGTSLGDTLEGLTSPAAGDAISHFADEASRALPVVTDAVGAIGGALSNIAVSIMPRLQEQFDTLRDKAKGIQEATDNFGGGDFRGNTAAPYLNAFADEAEHTAGFFSDLVELALEFGRVVAPYFGQFVDFLREGVRNMLRFLRSAEGQKKVKQFFEDTLPFIESLITFLGRLAVFLIRAFQLVAPFLAGVVDSVNSILAILNWLLGFLNGIFSNTIGRVIRYAIGEFFAFGVVRTIFLKVVGWIGKFLTFLTTNAGKAGGFVSKITGAFARIPGRILGYLSRAGASIQNWFARLPGRITGPVNTAVGWITRAGGRLLRGLIAGFTNNAQWIWDRITGLFTGILDFIKNLLGIHSPSKVFYDIGRNMLRGLIDGFTSGDAAKIVGRALVDLATDAPKIPLDITPMGLAGAAGRAIGDRIGLARGGLVTGPTNALIGEGRHSEAVLPLSERIFRRLGGAIASQMRFGVGTGAIMRGRMPALGSAAAGGRTTHIDKIVLPPPPGGGVPDARYQAVQLHRELIRRGGGGS